MAHVASDTRWAARERAGTAVVVSGLVAGVAAGVTMALFLVLAAALDGHDPLLALRPLGATFVGSEALSGGHAYVVYGIFVHLAVSALLGIVFAAVIPPVYSFMGAAVIGLGYAWFAMAVLMASVVPRVNPTLQASARVLGGSWVIAVGIFGAVLAIAPRLRARLRGHPEPRHGAAAA